VIGTIAIMPNRRRRSQILIATAATLALVFGALFAASCLIQWSSFTATSPVLRPDGRYERVERHLMFGRGRLAVLSMPVHSGAAFDQPTSDPNSHALAWAVHPQYFPSGWTGFRCSTYASGPVIGLPLWPPVAAAFVLTALLVYRERRRRLPGHCHRCRYDLSGLPEGSPCPECAAIANSGSR
jgi:glycine/D-amino acid oxidase-like deaminating enzyme